MKPLPTPHLPAWLVRFVAAMGGGGLFVVTFLDSFILSFPFVTDALIIELSSEHPARTPYYVAMSTLGSVAGSVLLFLLARKGGEAYFHRHGGRGALKAKRWVQRHAFLSIFIPALLPPPFQYKIFVLAEGVFEAPLRTFVLGVLFGRGIRYFAEAAFGIKYGQQTLVFLMAHGIAFAIGAVAAIVVLWIVARLFLRESE
ncbi:MAG: YqaA family protein [Candidatus Acidiferrales bacterium]